MSEANDANHYRPDTAPLIEGLRAHARLVDLRASRFYAERRTELDRLLATPVVGSFAPTAAGVGIDAAAGDVADGAPRLPDSLRVAQWNVEKGLRFDRIADALASHPDLAGADVVMLNEVDWGMARTGNRNVARALAERLRTHWAFAPAHVELTKGVGSDLDAPGENEVGLQGNAILSRHPLRDVRVVGLPICFEPYEFHEKRYGRRVAIVAKIETARGALALGGTHLEVRNTPACRARQARALVERMGERGPALIAGDFNASTFARGNVARTVRGTARLLGDADRLRESLDDIPSREPLFLELRRAGFRLDGWNTRDVTIVEYIGSLEDAKHLPPFVRGAILKRLDRLGRRLEFRLDWFAGREATPSDARTVKGLDASDHDAIVVDVRVG